MNKKEVNEYIENKINNNILENAIIFYGEEKDLFKEEILGFAGKVLCVDLFSLEENMEKPIPDLKIFETFWNKEEKTNIKIKDVKDFFSDINLKGTNGKKVYILDDADLLNINAQNAILKLIEEPNKGVYIFLIANKIDTLLKTIKSRCTKIYLHENIKTKYNFLEDEFGKKLEDIFLDALKLSRLKYIDKYNKLIDKKDVEYIIQNIEEIFEYSLEKNTDIAPSNEVLLDIKKKKSYNLNLNILKSELILGIYNSIKYKDKKNMDFKDKIYL